MHICRRRGCVMTGKSSGAPPSVTQAVCEFMVALALDWLSKYALMCIYAYDKATHFGRQAATRHHARMLVL